MLGIHHAFSDRSSALLTVQTLISELSSLNSRAEKLETTTSKIFGGDKSRVRKLEELKDAIRVTEDAKNCSIREYERIKVFGINPWLLYLVAFIIVGLHTLYPPRPTLWTTLGRLLYTCSHYGIYFILHSLLLFGKWFIVIR